MRTLLHAYINLLSRWFPLCIFVLLVLANALSQDKKLPFLSRSIARIINTLKRVLIMLYFARNNAHFCKVEPVRLYFVKSRALPRGSPRGGRGFAPCLRTLPSRVLHPAPAPSPGGRCRCIRCSSSAAQGVRAQLVKSQAVVFCCRKISTGTPADIDTQQHKKSPTAQQRCRAFCYSSISSSNLESPRTSSLTLRSSSSWLISPPPPEPEEPPFVDCSLSCLFSSSNRNIWSIRDLKTSRFISSIQLGITPISQKK